MAKVRVSIGNLACYIGPLSSRMVNVSIWNPKKERHVKALGGGAQLNDLGKKFLQEVFGATDFEGDHGVCDARFQVDEEQVEKVLDLFGNLKGCEQYELDRSADFMAEIEELGILTKEQLSKVEPELLVIKRQAPATNGTGTSERATMPTRRLFRKYVLRMPNDVLLAFLNSPRIRLMQDGELETTNGGANAGFTRDGVIIQDNLFL